MRIRLDIDDNILKAASKIARSEGRTVGQVISDLARRGLTVSSTRKLARRTVRGGVPLLPSRGEVVTFEHVRQIMHQVGL